MRYGFSCRISLSPATISLTTILLTTISLTTAGCSSFSSSKNKPVIYAAGDKAIVGPLIYTITDTQATQQLGDDPSTARTAQDRFFLVKVSISNSSADELPIPAMTLEDDSGHSYTELADGTNVPNWLGIVRKVAPAHTEEGNVVFDAPTRHYHLRLNDPLDDREIAIDVPLNFVHEELPSIDATPSTPLELPIPKK